MEKPSAEAYTWATVQGHAGHGKTMLVHGLAYGLTRLRKRVLVVDIDPRAELTREVCTRTKPTMTLADLLKGQTFQPDRFVIQTNAVRTLLPGAPDTEHAMQSPMAPRQQRRTLV